MLPFQLNSRPLDTNIDMGGLAEGPCPHGPLGFVAEGFVREGGESHQGRAAEEGEGGQEEEAAPEAMGAGMRGGH